MRKKRISFNIFICIIIIIISISCKSSKISINEDTYLEKITEIDGISSGNENKLLNISDICVSDEGTLYIADAIYKKIFMFNKKYQYIKSIGRSGQGPGEYTGDIILSNGQDGCLYTYDTGKRIIYKYENSGKYIESIKNDNNFIYEKPIVNKHGDMYLFSSNGYNIIDLYKRGKYYKSLVNVDIQISNDVKISNKYKKILRNRPDPVSIQKNILTNGDVFLTINTSLLFIKIDNNNIIKIMKIFNKDFNDDYSERIKNLKGEKTWIKCFGSVFEDINGNVNLCYFNSSINEPVIYRYSKYGEYIDRIRIYGEKEITNRVISICDKYGNYYGINNEKTKVNIYRIRGLL